MTIVPPRAAPSLVGAALPLLVAGLLAALAPRPHLDNRPTVWFPSSDPSLARWRDLVADFGGDEVVCLVVEGGDALGALRLAVDLGQALADDPAVASVTGPGTAFAREAEVLLDPDLGGLDNLRFVGFAFDGPLNRALCLWERDPARASTYCGLRPGEAAERAAFVTRLEPFRARAAAEGRRLLVAGHPVLNLALDEAARDVERRAMPLLVGVCVVVLVLALGSPRRAAALLAPVGLGVLATDGLLGLAGATSNLIVAIVKPLLFVLWLAAGFHVVVAYGHARAEGVAPWPAARRARSEKLWPTVLAALTTAIGMGSLIASDVAPIRAFGVHAAACVLLGLPLVLATLPVALALLDRRAGAPGPGDPGEADPARDPLGRACVALVRSGHAHPAAWLAGSVALGACGLGGALSLHPQPHALEYFRPEHPMRRDHDALVQGGTPLASIEALVTLPTPLGEDPAALARLDAFARDAAGVPGVRAVVGPPLFLREASHRTARVDALPAGLLVPDILRRQAAAFAGFLAEGGRRVRLSLACDEVDPAAYDAACAALEAAFVRAFPAAGPVAEPSGDPAASPAPRLELTGSYGLLLSTQRALLGTLRDSLLGTALLMQVVLVLVLRSVRLGLAALPPNAVPVAAIFAVMWAAGLPLDVGTSMTAAIALGIAVDGTLHFLHAWRAGDLDGTARTTGRAVVLTALVVGLGFLALTGSEFGPTRHFGLLCAVAMAAALVGDLLVLPATLRVLGGPGAGAPPAPA